MKKVRWINGAYLLPALLLLGLAMLFQCRLYSMQHDASRHPENTRRAPTPRVAFITIVLGGFRGLAADALWIRAAQMQQEGRYFEMVQLADWITQLEPQFSEVWAFNAWNLAYNISVFFNRPEDRWRWVQSGIALLRDEGIPCNPDDAQLYYELAWLFAHKLGSFTDSAHGYYKKAWSDAMRQCLGGPRPDYQHLQAPELLAPYKLDPAIMQVVEAQYGTLDWLRPQTHAIYWAFQGLPSADSFTRTRLQRLIFQSMAVLALGENTNDSESTAYYPSDLALLPYALQSYEQAIQDDPGNESIHQAYAYFLTAAAEKLRTAGNVAEANRLTNLLNDRYAERHE